MHLMPNRRQSLAWLASAGLPAWATAQTTAAPTQPSPPPRPGIKLPPMGG